MCTDCTTYKLIERLEACEKLVRNQNSGADVHQIGNIRNRIGMLVDTVSRLEIEKEEAYKMMLRIEAEIVEFFIKKYAPPDWVPPSKPCAERDPENNS